MTEQTVPLVVRRVIQASRARIFRAFSRSDLLSQWFTPSAEVSVTVLDFSFVTDGRFRLRYDMPDGRQAIVSGSYELIEQPARIILSWIWEAPDPLADIPMRVIFRFVERGDATEVVVTHEGIPSDTACTIHADGWVATLSRLEHFLGPTPAESRTRTIEHSSEKGTPS